VDVARLLGTHPLEFYDCVTKVVQSQERRTTSQAAGGNMPAKIPPESVAAPGKNALLPPQLFPANFQLLQSQPGWRLDWTNIVAGRFSQSPYSGLLFYERPAGYAEFYETDGEGGISLLQTHSDWRDSWDQVVPGVFSKSGFTGILLYDQVAGFVAIYDTDGSGNLIKLSEYGGMRTSWTHIVTVSLPNNDTSGVVFYDQAAGHMEVHASDESGSLTLLTSYDNLRTSWTQIVAGEFSSGAQLFFYEGSSSHGELYVIDENGNTTLSAQQDGLPAATDVIPGNFGWYGTSLLFYDRTSGTGTFVDYNAPGIGDGPTGFVIDGAESYDNWRTSWDIIVPGKFAVLDPEDVKFQVGFTDLLFYERTDGYGEFYRHDPYGSILVESLEGYTSSESVLQGGTIEFYINSRVGPYTIEVYREDLSEVLMTSVPVTLQFPGPYPIGPLAWRDGPKWPAAATLTIPENWPSGLYLARVVHLTLETQPGPAKALQRESVPRLLGGSPIIDTPVASVDIPFVVRTANRGSQSKILLCIANTTYQAYNFWGGRCLYGFRSRGYRVWSLGTTSAEHSLEQMPRAFRVSLRRPHNPLPDPDSPDVPQKKWQFWEVPLIRWLARQGIGVELCTESDIQENSELLKNYRLLVSMGHDEYWSAEMRNYVETFTVAGGNVAFLSGNICWWQIRFEENDDKIVCYKDRTFDPFNTTQPNLVTVNWYDAPVQHPETSMTGVSYLGTPAPYPGWVLCQQFVVQDSNHWALANTGLNDDDFFGVYAQNTLTVVGTETDRYQDKDPHSPQNFQKVATVFWKGRDAATMGTFVKGGTVFTASTINWLSGLSQDGSWGPIDQITRNVFDRLG
jgi:hypothetical protein